VTNDVAWEDCMNLTIDVALEKRVNPTIDGERTAGPVTLSDSERQPCEVWTRVMGYHRPVASFNIGKKGEHAERRFFREERARQKP
jgi:hypothetical protein